MNTAAHRVLWTAMRALRRLASVCSEHAVAANAGGPLICDSQPFTAAFRMLNPKMPTQCGVCYHVCQRPHAVKLAAPA